MSGGHGHVDPSNRKVALLISLLGFVSTVVLARFLARGDILR